jgi:hypothetical protein
MQNLPVAQQGRRRIDGRLLRVRVVGWDGIGLGGGDTGRVRDRAAAVGVTTKVTVALALAARLPRLQVTVVVPLQLPWLGVAENKTHARWQGIRHRDTRRIAGAVVGHSHG